jgi:hypothetical protein
MKKITIKDKHGKLLSDDNFCETEEQVQEFIRINKEHKVFGKDERWVRAKVEIEHIENPSVLIDIFPDEYYTHEDILEVKTKLNRYGTEENLVLLRADYTIEILDYKYVPKEVKMRQVRIALVRAGLYETIQNAIKNSNDEELKIEWEFSQVVKRNWPSLDTLTTSLGITSIQIDDLFISAENL